MIYFNENDSDSYTSPNKKCIRCGTTFQVVKGIFIEYFEESSIHGFRYIGEEKRPALDRIIWLFAVILSFLTCSYLIGNIWDKRSNEPVIVTFNEKLTPVWEIPFPTVTICTESKSHINFFNFTEIFWNISDNISISEDEQFYWEAISQTCRPRLVSGSYGHILANASDLIRAMLKVAPTFKDTFSECSWQLSKVDCAKYFDYVLTDEGICFSFNSLKSAYYRTELYNLRREDFIGFKYDNDRHLEWDLENGYDSQAGKDTFPKRVLGGEELESLIVVLRDRKENNEHMCRNGVHGFKITLHTPGEEPHVTKKFVSIPFDQTAVIAINPKIVTTSDGLADYPPERRQCYYQDERYLRYFTVYSQANCDLECLTNQTLAKCGCVKFSMPRNLSHPVCGAASVKCLDDVIKYSNIEKFKHRESTSSHIDNSSNYCHCLPTCIEIDYKAEVEHQVEINVAETTRAFRQDDLEELIANRVSYIHIHFKANVFNGLKRSELYSETDFIANCGGLLGLFMGVSTLSFVELVYFFTIRLWTNLKQRRINERRELRKKRKERNNKFIKTLY